MRAPQRRSAGSGPLRGRRAPKPSIKSAFSFHQERRPHLLEELGVSDCRLTLWKRAYLGQLKPGELEGEQLSPNLNFYVSIESDHPEIPASIPIPIQPTNFKDAKAAVGKFLHITRGVLRAAAGKAPDLPEQMKKIEPKVPAFPANQQFRRQN